MDADFQHPPIYIENFIKLSKTNDAIIFSGAEQYPGFNCKFMHALEY
jgi:hypothetical protein